MWKFSARIMLLLNAEALLTALLHIEVSFLLKDFLNRYHWYKISIKDIKLLCILVDRINTDLLMWERFVQRDISNRMDIWLHGEISKLSLYRYFSNDSFWLIIQRKLEITSDVMQDYSGTFAKQLILSNYMLRAQSY